MLTAFRFSSRSSTIRASGGSSSSRSPSGAAAGGSDIGKAVGLELLDDDVALDLVRAAGDLVQLHLAPPALHAVLDHVRVAAQDLHAAIDAAGRGLGARDLRD